MIETPTKYTAKDRRKQIHNSKLNGIDYIEVIRLDSPTCSNNQPYLIVYFFNPLSNELLDKSNVQIKGGLKVKNIRIEWAIPYTKIVNNNTTLPNKKRTTINEPTAQTIHNLFHKHIDAESRNKALIVCPTSDGDFSTYTLRIVDSLTPTNPPEGFDSILSSIDFSFKIDTPSKFDCKPDSAYCPEVLEEPVIDYLSKDYASFRHLVLSRLSLLMPNWQEQNVADIGIVMAELLAYVGDYLSYYQDAVATEAYLGTARSRISVKRHARLLDYHMHSGCNSRVWICIEAKVDNVILPKKTKFLTGLGNGDLVVDEADLEKELSQGTKVFEAMHDLALYRAHNTINFYTWGNSDYYLQKGSTQATLCDFYQYNTNDVTHRILNLKVGDVLIFEEIASCEGITENRDISHRHAVRLTKIKETSDMLSNPAICVVEIEWSLEDALPFSLCLAKGSVPVAVAYGNVLLADYGVSLKPEKLVDPIARLNFHPRLKRGPLTFSGPFDASISAFSAFNYDLQDVKASIYLRQLREPPENEFTEFRDTAWVPGIWIPQQDLLLSHKFKTDFVVETENDGTAVIRFGDGIYGLNPQIHTGEAPELLYGFYRVGNGTEGNVGAESIKRILDTNNTLEQFIHSIRNPLSARGGVDPETMAMVKQNVSETAKRNERAITDADYATIATQKCSDIQSAVAKTRWTGSWYTVYVMVERFGQKPVDEAFKIHVQNILKRYRLSGYDIEVCGPQHVPLEIEFIVNVSADLFCEDVEKNLLELFSNRTLPNGLRGFFHPDNFTIGQPVFLCALTAVMAKVDGVVSFSVTQFKRADKENDTDSIRERIIKISPYEIIQLDNDFNYPEHGHIAFTMTGGRKHDTE
jgi:hypothetical protein